MKIRRTDRFKKDYQKLPPEVQERLAQKLRLLVQNRNYLPIVIARRLEPPKQSLTSGEYYVLLGVGPHRIVDRM